MNVEPSDPVTVELKNQLEKKRAILSNKGLVNKLPDKGERIRQQITEIEEEINAIQNGHKYVRPKHDYDRTDSPVDVDMIEQEFTEKVTINERQFDPNSIADQLLKAHIEEEKKRMLGQHHNTKKTAFLLKPSAPMELDHSKRILDSAKKKPKPTSEQPEFLTETQILAQKGKRGKEYEKSQGTHKILVLDHKESIDQYKKHISYMEEMEEKRMFETQSGDSTPDDTMEDKDVNNDNDDPLEEEEEVEYYA